MVARGSDYWMSPQLLQKLEQQPPPNVEVRKAKLTLGGKQIPVFAVVARNSTTSYDEESGVLLHHTNGQINTKLVELRQRKLPWLEGRPPAWLGRTKQFTYTGALRSAQQPDMQVTQTIDVLGLGPNTLVGKGSAVAGNAGNSPPEERFIVSGSSQTDGYWLPPLDLKDLKQGQLIDEDRVVNARVTVGGIGRAAYGRNVVTIVEDAPGYSVISDFELETGILLMRTQAFKSFGMQITLSLTGLR